MGPDRGLGADDVEDVENVEIRRVQPYEARKRYRCPGCEHAIEPTVGHVVVVPLEAPELRRHWHHGCWEFRDRRRNR